MNIDINILIEIARMAGEKIKAIYDTGKIEVDKKDDILVRMNAGNKFTSGIQMKLMLIGDVLILNLL